MTIDYNELNDFIEKMKRRKVRFMNLLTNNDSLLLIRYEEDPTGRHDFKEYDEKYIFTATGVSFIKGLCSTINLMSMIQ